MAEQKKNTAEKKTPAKKPAAKKETALEQLKVQPPAVKKKAEIKITEEKTKKPAAKKVKEEIDEKPAVIHIAPDDKIPLEGERAKKAPAKKPSAKKEGKQEEAKAKPAPKGKKPSEEKASAKKVLFTVSESGPFIRSGGLGDVAEALPKALVKQGVDARVMLPLYRDIPEDYKQTMKYVGNVYVPLAWRYVYCGVFMLNLDGVTYYFLDNEYYFKRDGLYGHYDDAERFAFFSRACLEVLWLIDFFPDVIHANDWQTAPVPVFLDAFYKHIDKYNAIKTVFTIHNIEFQGKYGKELLRDILGLPEDKYSWVEYENCVNFMKGAIERSNAVTTVSRSYANEIKDPFFSYGLDHILNTRSYKLSGILNGINEKLYDPASDTALTKNYTLKSMRDKEENKEALMQFVGLPYNAGMPVIGMVTRLTEQKGLDLVMRVIDEMLSKDVQLVILGQGDWKYENALKEVQGRYEGKMKLIVNFSKDIASKIYAGADMFLMPSKFEPCGLSQMIAMRYGSIPVVREVGGLKDTVIPFNPAEKTGTGFTFYSYNAYDMLDAVCRAISTYYDKEEWDALIKNAMSMDFSWNNSAGQYIALYDRI